MIPGDATPPLLIGLAFSALAPPDRLFALDVEAADDLIRYDVDNAFDRGVVEDVIPQSPPLPPMQATDLTAIVPEPASVGMLLGGLLGVFFFHRRRSRADT